MGLIVGLVFVGVFTVIALPLIAARCRPPAARGRRLPRWTRRSSWRAGKSTSLRSMNMRKDEMLSSIPWLNKKLLKLELTPYLRRMLVQAALNWSAGRLLVMTAAGFFVPAYLLFLYFQSYLVPLVAGLVLGALPFGFVLFKRTRRMGAV